LIVKILGDEIKGRLVAPPSKSLTHRALVCSALVTGKSKIRYPLVSEDTLATLRVLSSLGVDTYFNDDYWEVSGGDLKRPKSTLFCGESGTTLRFTTALCSLVDGECGLTGGSSLIKRPIEPLLEGLRQLGVDCGSTNGLPPVTVRGKGRIMGGDVAIRGDISSQFVSALLLITPLGDSKTTLRLTTSLESKPYVSLTMDVQREFGVEVQASDDMRAFQVEKQNYRPTEIEVEGDWSSSSYLLAAGALNGEVTVFNLNTDSLQADLKIVDILDAMGAEIRLREKSITTRKKGLNGIETDLRDFPDLFPVIASLCASASGRSVLRGLGRLRYKESDRVKVMIEGLRKMGVKVRLEGNSLVVEGGKLRGCVIDPHNDHRIAMAFALLGLVAEDETTVLDAECVAKSYPDFWDDLEYIGANVRRILNEQ
jgi:3-phosphoshikimate 1-carboxyvinyltransferase